jgi:hypothetical protein
MKHSIALMTMLLTLAACNGGSDSGSKKEAASIPEKTDTPSYTNKPQEQEDEPSNAEDFTIKKTRKVNLDKTSFSNFEAYKNNLNNWKIKFEARSAAYNNAVIECKKITANQSDQNILNASFDNKGIAELELTIEKDDPTKVDFNCKISDREFEIKSTKIELTKSVLVTEKKNLIALALSDSDTIETLVLDEGAVLITDGKNVNLTMNELVSNGGKIVTFDSEVPYVPTPNEAGKSGGIINLVTKKARGSITFELRGLPAGIQTHAQADQFQFPAVDPALNGQNVDQLKRCRPNVGNGRQGHKGLIGYQGLKGFKGGDAGLLLFRSLDQNSLKIHVLPLPGNGGTGGPGGKGGPGGAGGKGGTWWQYMVGNGVCQDGPQGPPGDQGVLGETGSQGNIPKSSLTFQKEGLFIDVDSEWSN